MLFQQLQGQSIVEDAVQRCVLDLRCLPLGFPELIHFQGYNTKMDGLSINNKILFLTVSSLCLMTIKRGTGKETEGRNICKTLCSYCSC